MRSYHEKKKAKNVRKRVPRTRSRLVSSKSSDLASVERNLIRDGESGYSILRYLNSTRTAISLNRRFYGGVHYLPRRHIQNTADESRVKWKTREGDRCGRYGSYPETGEKDAHIRTYARRRRERERERERERAREQREG